MWTGESGKVYRANAAVRNFKLAVKIFHVYVGCLFPMFPYIRPEQSKTEVSSYGGYDVIFYYSDPLPVKGVPFHWKPDWGMHQMRRYGDEYSRISSFGMICSPFIARIYLVEFARWQGGWFRINCEVLNTLCVVFMFLCIREVFYGHNRPFGVSFVAPRSLSLQFKPINARSFRFTLSMCGYKHIVSVY